MSEVKFGTITPTGLTNVRYIRSSDIAACPHSILVAEHYREDGSCRCDDPEAPMGEWGYTWDVEAGRWE